MTNQELRYAQKMIFSIVAWKEEMLVVCPSHKWREIIRMAEIEIQKIITMYRPAIILKNGGKFYL